MSLSVHCLGSGSSGNATLIQCNDKFLLIDAGVGPRKLTEAMKRRGLAVGDLLAIVITHEHDDHIKGIASISKRYQVPVVANRHTLGAMAVRVEAHTTRELKTQDTVQMGPFEIHSFPVPHDAVEPVGFVIKADGRRVFYATDVGHPTESVRSNLKDCDLCVIESNYDPMMLRNGPYPEHMKVRVAGKTGHLSNDSAAELIVEQMDQDKPCTFWLAHLSAVNNSPRVAKMCVEQKLEAIHNKRCHLEVALRDRPSVSWIAGQMANQLSLFD